MTHVIDPKLYTNDELIKTYHQQVGDMRIRMLIFLCNLHILQKEACRELNKTILNNSLQAISVNECDNRIAVVRRLNMVESPVASPKNSAESLIDGKTTSTESLKSLEEKAMVEKSEKEINTENAKQVVIEESPQKYVELRVQPITQETACQTDETAESQENTSALAANGDPIETSKVNLRSTTHTREKHPDELDFENLSKDLASQLSPSDKLHSILGKLPLMRNLAKFLDAD